MKYTSLLLLVCLVNFCSCKKFLDEQPRIQQSVNTFFATRADFDLALNGSYAAVRGVYGSPSAWLMGEMRSDNTHYDYKASDQALLVVQRNNIADFTDDKYNGQSSPKWTACFNAIAAVNNIFDHIDNGVLKDTAQSRIKGEALFLRALCYYELVKYYGGVPIYLHEVQNRDDTYVGRSSADDVYKLIIADLTEAGQKLAAPSFPQSGRATKGAVYTLLADVYMSRKEYALAEGLLKQVVQMGYALLPSYASVYDLSNKNSKESVFEIQYNASMQGQWSNFVYNFIPRMTNSAIITGPSQNTVTNLGGFNTPTDDLIKDYEPGDSRLEASVEIAEGSFDASDNFVCTAVKPVTGYVAPAGKTGRPFIQKYLHTHAIAGQTNDNWPVYRYAEVLLLLAEALNEQGKGNEALQYLNQVRQRAFGAGNGLITTTDQAALKRIILHERRVELAFENKRWYDLVRSGKAIEVMTAFGIKQKQRYSYLSPDSYNITATRLLFPVPNTEMLLNPKLTQNDGY
jgi:tetratricopeptide (TPR) repeat protein